MPENQANALTLFILLAFLSRFVLMRAKFSIINFLIDKFLLIKPAFFYILKTNSQKTGEYDE
jgi:hypothetical protein